MHPVNNYLNKEGLLCGKTYNITVQAVINGVLGKETKTSLTVDPKIGAVTNLTVKFIPADGSTVKELIKESFHLTWSQPKNVNTHDIEVSTQCIYLYPLGQCSL